MEGMELAKRGVRKGVVLALGMGGIAIFEDGFQGEGSRMDGLRGGEYVGESLDKSRKGSGSGFGQPYSFESRL